MPRGEAVVSARRAVRKVRENMVGLMMWEWVVVVYVYIRSGRGLEDGMRGRERRGVGDGGRWNVDHVSARDLRVWSRFG